MTGSYTVIDFSSLANRKIACLTLDVEQDYGDLLDEPSYEGLDHIPELVGFLAAKGIPLTCFVQGSLFDTCSEQIKALSSINTEFELHSYSHPAPQRANAEVEIKEGKAAYRGFFGRDPLGYRAPLGVVHDSDYAVLAASGFKFDSSIFPSFRPGAFNNLWKPTRPYLLDSYQIIEFPFAVVSSIIRIPVALSYMKLLGTPYLCLLRNYVLPGLIIFDFHLHDLFSLGSANKIPLGKFSPVYRRVFRRIYRQDGEGLAILDRLISILRGKGYTFQRLIDVYEAIPK